MDKIIFVDDDLKNEAIEFIRNHKENVISDDVREAIKIRGKIIRQISDQYNELMKEFSDIKTEIEESDLHEYAKEQKIKEKYNKFDNSITRDVFADYCVDSLSNFIIDNSSCDVCADCASLIGVYRSYKEKYNKATVDEIDQTRQKLCDAVQNCKKARCRARDLIDFIDNDPTIKKNKGI